MGGSIDKKFWARGCDDRAGDSSLKSLVGHVPHFQSDAGPASRTSIAGRSHKSGEGSLLSREAAPQFRQTDCAVHCTTALKKFSDPSADDTEPAFN